MGRSQPTSAEIATVLDRADALLQQLKGEPWAEYDPVLQKALLSIMKKGFGHYQVVAKAIARVEPAETRSEATPGAHWFDDALDEERPR